MRARDMTNGEIFMAIRTRTSYFFFTPRGDRKTERTGEEEEEEGRDCESLGKRERKRKSSWHIIKRGKFGTAGGHE